MKIQQFKNLRQPPTPEQMDQKLKDVSKLYEKQFLREMTKQMRSTVSEGGFIQANQAEKIFREQLDDEYVEKWGDHGGIGLADMIHQQLLDKLGPSMGLRPQPTRPQGPIKIDEKSLQQNPLKVQSQAGASPSRPSSKVSMQYDLQKAALEDGEVSSPWSGTLLGVKNLNQDENLLEIAHDNGLKSQLVFRGTLEKNLQAAQMKPGAEIQAGQRLGLLSPEAKSFFWNVDVAGSL
jgi:flagellar protein FlgJ